MYKNVLVVFAGHSLNLGDRETLIISAAYVAGVNDGMLNKKLDGKRGYANRELFPKRRPSTES